MTQPIPPIPPSNQPFPQGAAAPIGYAQPMRNDIREIAVRQRAIMFCLLGLIVSIVLYAVVPGVLLKGVFGLAYLAISITSCVFVFMLSLAVYDQVTGILLGIGTLIPCVGVICLLIVNGKATNILKANGIKVGLMGANMKQIPAAGTTVR